MATEGRSEQWVVGEPVCGLGGGLKCGERLLQSTACTRDTRDVGPPLVPGQHVLVATVMAPDRHCVCRTQGLNMGFPTEN